MKQRRPLLISVAVIFVLAGGCGLSLWCAKRQYALNRQLIAALVHDDTNKQLLEYGANPNSVVANGWTAIEQAETYHRADIVALLKRRGK